MSKITRETLTNAHKPYDIVSTIDGKSVGFIQETSLNRSQDDSKHQIAYTVNWLTGPEDTIAWWEHDDLINHCNLFVKIAECSCDDMGSGESNVKTLFKHF